MNVADGRGGTTSGTVTITISPVNDPPRAVNDLLFIGRGPAVPLRVLENDSDPDGDALTVTLIGNPLVGTATVNADGTVSIGAIPFVEAFSGLTRFEYRIQDPAGASSSATVLAMIATLPFRIVLQADERQDRSPELYLTNLLDAPRRLSSATAGARRLRDFVAAANGEAVLFTRADPANLNATLEYCYLRTAAGSAQSCLTLPAGTVPVSEAGRPVYALSPEGRWAAVLAARADGALASTLHLLDGNAPGSFAAIEVAEAPHVTRVEFAQAPGRALHLYLAAAARVRPQAEAMYQFTPGTTGSLRRISAVASAAHSITGFFVAPDDSRVAMRLAINGVLGLYHLEAGIGPLPNEIRISHDLAAGESRGGSARLDRFLVGISGSA